MRHFGLLTAQGADPTSWFFYMKTKGEVERDVRALGLQQLTIYQPGLIENRRNDYRVGESILSYVPFIKKIEARQLGESILLHAVQILTNSEFPRGQDGVLTLSNNQIREGHRVILEARRGNENENAKE